MKSDISHKLSVRRQRTEEIRNIKPRWTRLSDRSEVFLASGVLSRIDELPLGQKDELIEECHNVAPRLMDREDNGAVIVSGKRNKTLHNIVSVVCIQT